MIKFHNIDIEENYIATSELYNKYQSNSDSDICHCEECKNFRTYKHNLFSHAFKNLLLSLGINPLFDSGIWAYELKEEEVVCYNFYYYFFGKILNDTAIEDRVFEQDTSPYIVSFSFSKELDNKYKISVFAKLPWNLSESKLPDLEYSVYAATNDELVLEFKDEEKLKPFRISLIALDNVSNIETEYSNGIGICKIAMHKFPNSEFIRIETNIDSSHKSRYITLRKNGI